MVIIILRKEHLVMDLKIHHIGYLVKDLDKAAERFCGLGFKKCSGITHDELRHINICFVKKDGYVIELVQPYDNESTVSSLIKKYKNAPYHVCYETNNIDRTISELKTQKFTVIDNPMPAPAFNGKMIVFLINHNVGMIELVEE